METRNTATNCQSQISFDHHTKIHQRTNEGSKTFFKKVFETYNYDLYGKLFKLESKPFQNYLKYNDLKKGEKRIVEYFIEESAVKNNTILPIVKRERGSTIGNKTPFFTPLSSDTKNNVRRNLKTINSNIESKLIELAISIITNGIEEPKLEIKLYKVDYNAIQGAINNVSDKDYSKEEIVAAIALIGHFERYDSLSIGKKVWGAIFRHSDYKAIIEVLIKLNILTKTGNSIVGWRSNIYSFNIYRRIETFTLTEKKVLNRIKNAKITFSKYSHEKQLEMALNEGCMELVEDIETLIEGHKYINSGSNKSKLEEEYDWMQYENMLISFSIHFQNQKKIAMETGVYKSFWTVRRAATMDRLIAHLDSIGMDTSCFKRD